jgi:hypothetical protein
MMATKLEKCANMLNEAFRTKLPAAFHAKFGAELETSFNLFSMSLVSRRVDGADFTPEQYAWVEAYSDGFGDALELVRTEANKHYFAKEANGES